MTPLHLLWLPILLSSVVVFIVSAFIHMISPWHKSDYPRLEKQDDIMNALRPFALSPGEYLVPRPADMKDMSSPEFAEKRKKGPVVILTVMKGDSMSMSRPLILWFLYSIVVGIFAAYVAGRALPMSAHYLAVFRFAGVTAFLAYSAALWQASIWYGRPWMNVVKSTVDGLIYALLTAGVFGWLWPR